ncbi:uncharacterized protein N7496_002874 [Penicillium cataractarum]|uniref:Fungal-specific transcription factor domain-containing protein n=1 Tax=Penicillium cataractarum TaxID=2100454 RepID=A0A9W9SKX4_9EURO|nr:uncharacterized protein N7496_002874 [Penicillium cataractarum]KAJ5380446.1 hypothetical protein N7496_002874 [Penicillium cataractarum]
MPLVHQPLLNHSPYLLSEESRFLMHTFATQTAQMLFPAAPDFFLQRMISAAMETPHLLHALLASSCSHHSRLIQDSGPRSKMICLKYTNMAIAGLRAALCDQDQATKPETVTTAMALCTNDVCNGNMKIWRTHLRGVLRILMALLQHQRVSLKLMDDPFIQCLVKWFKTMDILAALSGAHGECIHNPGNGPLNGLSDYATWHVDEISGYSLELIPTLAEVSKLASQIRPHASGETEEDYSPSLETMIQAEDLESKLFQLFDRPVCDETLSRGGSLALELHGTHLAFVHSALLHLHRRVQLHPKDHIKVRADVQNILEALSLIEPHSPMNILILWPIFSAGCETEESEERDTILARMGNMQKLGMGNFTRAREVLHRYWVSGSKLPWDIYLAKLGLELVLF